MFKDISDANLRVTLAASLLDEFFPITAWEAHQGHFLLWCLSNAPWSSTQDAHAAAGLAWRILEKNPSEQLVLRSTIEPYQCVLVVPQNKGLFEAVGYSVSYDFWDFDNVLAQMAPFVGRRTHAFNIARYDDVA